jgi:alcohol dehydrogenase (cytochrome c)
MAVLVRARAKLAWYLQAVPHDTHDWIRGYQSLFTASPSAAKTRNVVALGAKDGFLRLVDRETHEVIYSVPVTTRIEHRARNRRRKACIPARALRRRRMERSGVQPQLDLLVVPAVDWCGVYKKDDELRFVAGQLYSADPLHGIRSTNRADG